MGDPYVYDEDLVGTGIEKVYLFNTLNGASITYTSSSPAIRFYRYRQSFANKEPVPSSDINESSSGGETTYAVSNLLDGWGYYIEGSSIGVIWIIDYSEHRSVVNSISVVEDDDVCVNLKLLISKQDDLFFYTTAGVKKDIRSRHTLSYNTQGWENNKFVDSVIVLKDQVIGTELVVESPLKDTRFVLEGDQFALNFGLSGTRVESDLYEAKAVKTRIVAIQDENTSGNISSSEKEEIGGAAPANIRFYGHGSEAAYFYIWNIYNQKNPENSIVRYTDKDISYRFEQSGDYKVVLEVADETSFCVDTTSVSFKITESSLDAPNFFSPGDSPGVNDEFRVAYKSLIRFKCTIFNRWGVKLYEWTDPAKGWDGRYKGNYVKPGVYFYVIEAEGSDGIKYKEAKAINIVRSR